MYNKKKYLKIIFITLSLLIGQIRCNNITFVNSMNPQINKNSKNKSIKANNKFLNKKSILSKKNKSESLISVDKLLGMYFTNFFLDFFDLINLSITCKKFNNYINEVDFWDNKEVYIPFFPVWNSSYIPCDIYYGNQFKKLKKVGKITLYSVPKDYLENGNYYFYDDDNSSFFDQTKLYFFINKITAINLTKLQEDKENISRSKSKLIYLFGENSIFENVERLILNKNSFSDNKNKMIWIEKLNYYYPKLNKSSITNKNIIFFENKNKSLVKSENNFTKAICTDLRLEIYNFLYFIDLMTLANSCKDLWYEINNNKIIWKEKLYHIPFISSNNLRNFSFKIPKNINLYNKIKLCFVDKNKENQKTQKLIHYNTLNIKPRNIDMQICFTSNFKKEFPKKDCNKVKQFIKIQPYYINYFIKKNYIFSKVKKVSLIKSKLKNDINNDFKNLQQICPNLNELDLIIKDYFWDSIIELNFKNLETLYINTESNLNITFLENCKTIKNLDITYNEPPEYFFESDNHGIYFDDFMDYGGSYGRHIFWEGMSNLKNLEKLTIKINKEWNTKHIINFLKECPKLKTIDLDYYVSSDTNELFILSQVKNLEEIKINFKYCELASNIILPHKSLLKAKTKTFTADSEIKLLFLKEYK